MKIGNILLFILLAVLLFTSCYCDAPETGLVKISPSARAWISYQPEQNLVFARPFGQPDVLQVIQYTDSVENYIVGDECPDGMQEVIRALISSTTLNDTIRIEIINQRINIHKDIISLTYLVDDKLIFPKDQPGNYALLDSVVLAGKTFSQVLKARCLSCDQEKVTELYVAKETGLIGYVKNRELWTLQ